MTKNKSSNSSVLLKTFQLFLIFQILIFFIWLIEYITDLQENSWFAGLASAFFYMCLIVLNVMLLISYAIQVRNDKVKREPARWDGTVKVLIIINVILVLVALLCANFLGSNY